MNNGRHNPIEMQPKKALRKIKAARLQAARKVIVQYLCANGKTVNDSSSWVGLARITASLLKHPLPKGRMKKNAAEGLVLAYAKEIDEKGLLTGVRKRSSFYDSRQWRELRYEALLKYGRKCSCCGIEAGLGVPLHVDHIKPRSKYPDLALDINNLQVLCEMCNLGKGAWDETDFRE